MCIITTPTVCMTQLSSLTSYVSIVTTLHNLLLLFLFLFFYFLLLIYLMELKVWSE